jgi:hypothetical protein
MPYKDPTKQREAVRKAVAKKRVIPSQDVIPECNTQVAELHNPQDQAWAHLRTFISTPSEGMSNLEKMQRIAGSLNKYADQVFFGASFELNMEQIGKVIGTKEALW